MKTVFITIFIELIPNTETAMILRDFNKRLESEFNSYSKLVPSGTMSLSYETIEQKRKLIMCERYTFSTIGGFLYIDLFKGLENHFLPRKCGLCGRYFLLEAVAYSAYCTRKVRGRDGKRCRDLGHRKNYAEKVNSDPIMLAFVRAYKQHYGCYLKKKMTQDEFRQWCDFALALREKAYNGTVEFEEYRGRIRE